MVYNELGRIHERVLITGKNNEKDDLRASRVCFL